MSQGQKARLLELIRTKAYREGEITLSSGQKSDYYIDGRMIAVSPEAAYLIGQVLFDHLQCFEFDAVGGMAVGAVPTVTSIVIASHLQERPVEGFFVRSEIKKHGMQKKVEGGVEPKSRVVVVDDVVTSGGSTMKAIEAIEAERECEVVGVGCLVDRQSGASELFAERGYDYRPVFTVADLKSSSGS